MKTNRKNNLKIIAACSVAIFSLLAVIGGAYSWFTLELQRALEPTSFAVVNLGTCELYSIDMYKFNYYSHQYGSSTVIDYFNPELGNVGKYQYDKDLGQFGYNDPDWHQVSMMNTYDPVDLALFGGGVESLNCNSIYKFVIASYNLTSVSFDSTVERIVETIKQDEEIYLSSCADFDIFYEADLLDSNPAYTQGDDHKMYYPDYIDKSETLTEEEELYYKLSYLASLKDSHANLYSGSGHNALASEVPVTFVYDSALDLSFFTVYVNVNYAPSQLEDTMYRIYQQDIKAICDFGFKFYFFPGDNH